jgi:hypothetical protein
MTEYAQRDHIALGHYYLQHLSAMTGEQLHAKSDIAAELAWRDQQIDNLRAALYTQIKDEHVYMGSCPISSDIMRRDLDCPACRVLMICDKENLL